MPVYCPYNKDKFDKEKYIKEFENYFRAKHYKEICDVLNAMDTMGQYSIVVSALDILDANVMLGTLLLTYPNEFLPHFQQALQNIQQEILTEHEEADKALMSVKTNYHVRVYHFPQCPETTKLSVSSIRSSDIHRLISVSGTVIRTGPVKMLEYQKEFSCTKCKRRKVVKADLEQGNMIIKPVHCGNAGCDGTSFKTLDESQVVKDYQEIKIQDKISQLQVGSIPRSIIVILEDDLVDKCKAGDEVIISGIVMRRWKPVKPEARCSIEMIIYGNHIYINNENKNSVNVTDEMKQEFEAFWKKFATSPLRARNVILKSLCPQLYGLFSVKMALALTLIGGVPMVHQGTKIRGESHLLIVGDPGTGKSQILKYAAKISPRHVLTTGIGTTSAGLTVMATKESGDWTLEAGALVLADGGVCCIDEFDSIREHDRATIHEAMEQQTLSIAKAGLVCKLNTRTTVISACNPRGKYDLAASLSVNVALASPLLSRFDIVLVLLDKQDSEWDGQVSSFILQEEQVESEEEDQDLWNLDKLKAYIAYVKREFTPAIRPECGDVLKRYYQMQRQAGQRVAARTTIRLLQSLARLAQAHARLMFRNEATIQDAIMAILTIDSSMHTTPLIDFKSTLHTNFPEHPDEEYLDIERRVLTKLGVYDDIHPHVSGGNDQEEDNEGDENHKFNFRAPKLQNPLAKAPVTTNRLGPTSGISTQDRVQRAKALGILSQTPKNNSNEENEQPAEEHEEQMEQEEVPANDEEIEDEPADEAEEEWIENLKAPEEPKRQSKPAPTPSVSSSQHVNSNENNPKRKREVIEVPRLTQDEEENDDTQELFEEYRANKKQKSVDTRPTPPPNKSPEEPPSRPTTSLAPPGKQPIVPAKKVSLPSPNAKPITIAKTATTQKPLPPPASNSALRKPPTAKLPPPTIKPIIKTAAIRKPILEDEDDDETTLSQQLRAINGE